MTPSEPDPKQQREAKTDIAMIADIPIKGLKPEQIQAKLKQNISAFHKAAVRRYDFLKFDFREVKVFKEDPGKCIFMIDVTDPRDALRTQQLLVNLWNEIAWSDKNITNAIMALLTTEGQDARIQAGEKVWASDEDGLLYAFHLCYDQADECRDAVRDVLNTLLASPSARQDKFLKLFMLAWCSDDEFLSQLGLDLLALRSKHGDFYDPTAKTAAREIGLKANELGGLDAMRRLYNAVEWVVGSEAAHGLTFAWSRVGGWMV